jgi:ferredoxin-NADP reductase
MDFRFERVDGERVNYEPGQFFRFTLKDAGGAFERSYSLCNFETDVGDTDLDLVVSTVEGGRASQVLFNAEPGFTASVSGPYGRLILPALMPRRLFLVAASVGIAPYMPMLDSLETKLEAGLEVHFLYGTRDHTEFVYGAELQAFAKRHPNFHLHLCLSRCNPDDQLLVRQIRGYVQDELFTLDPNPETDHVLLCGNPGMIDDIYPRLKALGFGVRQVVREKYVFAKDGQAVKKVEMSEEQKRLLAEKMKKYQS